jgi:transcriptional regulator with XRE-family HTH domain
LRTNTGNKVRSSLPLTSSNNSAKWIIRQIKYRCSRTCAWPKTRLFNFVSIALTPNVKSILENEAIIVHWTVRCMLVCWNWQQFSWITLIVVVIDKLSVYLSEKRLALPRKGDVDMQQQSNLRPIAQAFRFLRECQHLSQRAVSSFQYTASNLSRFEHGIRSPYVSTLVDLCSNMNVTNKVFGFVSGGAMVAMVIWLQYIIGKNSNRFVEHVNSWKIIAWNNRVFLLRRKKPRQAGVSSCIRR